VIVKLKNDETGSLETYLDEHNMKISDDKLNFGKILTAINVVMSVLVFIGTAFMAFSLVIVMLNFSLMVAQAKEEVSLLLQLGYKAKHLIGHLSLYLFVFMTSVVLLSAIVFAIGNNLLLTFLTDNGFDVTGNVSPEVIILGSAFILVSVSVSYYSISRLIRRHL
jgi:ABC-type antimicrobial peptide transport system permease subunit